MSAHRVCAYLHCSARGFLGILVVQLELDLSIALKPQESWPQPEDLSLNIQVRRSSCRLQLDVQRHPRLASRSVPGPPTTPTGPTCSEVWTSQPSRVWILGLGFMHILMFARLLTEMERHVPSRSTVRPPPRRSLQRSIDSRQYLTQGMAPSLGSNLLLPGYLISAMTMRGLRM